MKRIASESTYTRFTMQMLKDGASASLVSWFTDMVSLSLATDAAFTDDITESLSYGSFWYKMDAELRDILPQLNDKHTVQGYHLIEI
jgi:hypothetical protein